MEMGVRGHLGFGQWREIALTIRLSNQLSEFLGSHLPFVHADVRYLVASVDLHTDDVGVLAEALLDNGLAPIARNWASWDGD